MTAHQAQRKTGIVTGAASGIGRATALRLAGDGFTVALLDLDRAGADETRNRIEQVGGIAQDIAVDLRVPGEVVSAVADVESGLGNPDVLVNVAGVGVAATASIPPRRREDFPPVRQRCLSAPLRVVRCSDERCGAVLRAAADSPQEYPDAPGLRARLHRIWRLGDSATAVPVGCEARPQLTVERAVPGYAAPPMYPVVGGAGMPRSWRDALRTTGLCGISPGRPAAQARAYLSGSSGRRLSERRPHGHHRSVTDFPGRVRTVRVTPLAITWVVPPPVLWTTHSVTRPRRQAKSMEKPPRAPAPVMRPRSAQAAGSAGRSSMRPGWE